MRRIITLTLAVTVFSTLSIGQKRYLDEVFSDVTVMTDQVYGANITVVTGAPALDTLHYDLYMPAGDTCASRPLVVVLPTGTFLPRGLFAPTGAKDDYANVRACQMLAKRGYVAASVQYRVGWNPISPEDTTRRATIIQAAYRSIQDMYAFIRFMNMTVDNLANPYNLDMSRVAVFGIGTGGFVNLNAAVLTQDKIYIDKFRNPVSGVPYIDTLLLGDLHGVKPGLINIPNNVGYNDNFNFVFSLDGAIGDSSWIEDGNSVPVVAAGTVTHPTTPYGIDPDDPTMINCDLPVTAGVGTGVYVVNIAGTLCVMEKANSLGINDPLNVDPYDDPVSVAVRADANNFGQEHLWAINLPGPQAGPWEYWDSTFWAGVPSPIPGMSIDAYAKLTNPDMSMEKANAYMDTAIWFFAPRAYNALKLGGVICNCDHVTPDPTIVNDFECHKNYPFGTGNDKLRIIDNPQPDADNGSLKVGEYRDPANDPWAALCVDFVNPIDLSVLNQFEVQINAPAEVPILFKLEGGTSAAYETWLNITAPGTWETLTADFSSQAAENHTRVCMFPNGGVGQATEDKYYLDNLRWRMSSGTLNPTVDALEVSPNPVSTVLYVLNPGDAVQFRLFNALGEFISNTNANGENVVPVFMSQLPQGMYLLTAYNQEGKLVANARILKQ